MLPGNISLLAWILLQVVQLDLLPGVQLHGLPVPGPQGLLPPELPVEEFVARLLPASQRIEEGDSIDIPGNLCTRQLAGCGEEVPESERLGAGRARLNYPGPPADGGDTDPTLVEVALESAQGSVGIKNFVAVTTL